MVDCIMTRVLILLALYLFSASAAARMFQWVDPDTGTTQLSGVPPVWYRSGEPGPRVFVFENGKVVDDTGIAVSDGERQRLRQEAFLRAQQDQQAYLERMREAQRVKAAMDRKLPNEEAEIVDEVPEPEVMEEPGTQTAEAEQPDAPTAEELRELIEAWERARTEEARQRIEGAQADSPAAQ